MKIEIIPSLNYNSTLLKLSFLPQNQIDLFYVFITSHTTTDVQSSPQYSGALLAKKSIATLCTEAKTSHS